MSGDTSSISTPYKSKFKIQSRGFVAFPAWLIDEMMKVGKNIPPSFWKFLLILFRDCNHHKDNTCKRSMRQFHIRAEDAMLWTAAVMVSGLFRVQYGWKHQKMEKGVPTVFTYLDSDFQQWEIFIEALAAQLKSDKQHHYKDSGGGFRAALQIQILKIQIEKYGVPVNPDQKAFLNKLDKGGWVKVTKTDGVATFEVHGRLPSNRAGVLSTTEQIEGAYPSKEEPQYDDSGKILRMYRQPKTSTAITTIDLRKRTVPTADQ